MEQVNSQAAMVTPASPAPPAVQVHGGKDHVPHVLPLNRYLGVWAALLTLTGITVAVSYFDFGEWNIVVALLVASAKATMVAAIFMHLAYDRKFHTIVLLVAVLFFVILLALTMADTLTRSIGDPIEGQVPQNVEQPFKEGKPAPRGTAPLETPTPQEIEVPHLP